ncbi:hypothetical protein EIP91_001245 [Steccherinum ochraceum]|uniref:Uncharacterized protein n=1 Tax=Steccherinum ochraceum TaxID=92696 RepID=A0A4V6N765_9APHY|nr:hypothetical protein EIP91_001245 [Steccherinum ochraceum]
MHQTRVQSFAIYARVRTNITMFVRSSTYFRYPCLRFLSKQIKMAAYDLDQTFRFVNSKPYTPSNADGRTENEAHGLHQSARTISSDSLDHSFGTAEAEDGIQRDDFAAVAHPNARPAASFPHDISEHGSKYDGADEPRASENHSEGSPETLERILAELEDAESTLPSPPLFTVTLPPAPRPLSPSRRPDSPSGPRPRSTRLTPNSDISPSLSRRPAVSKKLSGRLSAVLSLDRTPPPERHLALHSRPSSVRTKGTTSAKSVRQLTVDDRSVGGSSISSVRPPPTPSPATSLTNISAEGRAPVVLHPSDGPNSDDFGRLPLSVSKRSLTRPSEASNPVHAVYREYIPLEARQLTTHQNLTPSASFVRLAPHASNLPVAARSTRTLNNLPEDGARTTLLHRPIPLAEPSESEQAHKATSRSSPAVQIPEKKRWLCCCIM